MDTSRFRSSANVSDVRRNQSENVLLYEALLDRAADPRTPPRERRMVEEQLRRLLPFEFNPGSGRPGRLQGGSVAGDIQPGVGPGRAPQRPIGFDDEYAGTPAGQMRLRAHLDELSGMIQNPRDRSDELVRLGWDYMRDEPNRRVPMMAAAGMRPKAGDAPALPETPAALDEFDAPANLTGTPTPVVGRSPQAESFMRQWEAYRQSLKTAPRSGSGRDPNYRTPAILGIRG
jgi:hypothetical protein